MLMKEEKLINHQMFVKNENSFFMTEVGNLTDTIIDLKNTCLSVLKKIDVNDSHLDDKDKLRQIMEENIQLKKRLEINEIEKNGFKKIAEVCVKASIAISNKEKEDIIKQICKSDTKSLTAPDKRKHEDGDDVLMNRNKMAKHEYLNQHLNTKKIVNTLNEYLKVNGITRTFFSFEVLCVSRAYLIEVLQNPIDFYKLTGHGQKIYKDIDTFLSDEFRKKKVIDVFKQKQTLILTQPLKKINSREENVNNNNNNNNEEIIPQLKDICDKNNDNNCNSDGGDDEVRLSDGLKNEVIEHVDSSHQNDYDYDEDEIIEIIIGEDDDD